MIQFLSILVEHTALNLNQPFTYSFEGPTLYPGCRVWIEFNHQKLVGFILDVSKVKPITNYPISSILEVIDEQPLLTNELMEIAQQYSQETFISHIALLQAMLPPSLKPRKSSTKSPKIKYENWVQLSEKKAEQLNPKQQELYDLLKEQKFTKYSYIRQKSTLKSLLDLQLIVIIKKEKLRYRLQYEELQEKFERTPDQQRALESMITTSKMTTLLQGVTGSGKTELYIALAKEALNKQKTTLMIVPEIALTPMMVSYFGKHFKDLVAVLHSDLSPAERYDEYRKIYRGQAQVVIGARSAIFAPLSNIGYIIIDEEHSETYKQDVPPFYHVLEIAKKRANYHQAKIILGSATPSLETKARAQKGLYEWVVLSKRIHQINSPTVHIVDMNQYQGSTQSFLFSKPLFDAMQVALQKKEQIILLLNKRGYAQSFVCRECQYTFLCPSCRLPLNVHVHSHNLKCHYCDHVEPYPTMCPECQSQYFNRLGFGTQRVEEEVRKLFPGEKIIRLDADTTQLRQSVGKLLNTFKQQEASILIGTQMVAKGHDFPNVTVVGVVLADLGLTIPSYRSNERTFQLLTQAIGRTGRHEKEGQAYIQTFNPHHDVIRFAQSQDYEGFYRFEMVQRKLGLYPPYRYLVALEILSRQSDLVIQSAEAIKSILIKSVPLEDVLGPVTPFLEKKGPFYRRNILIKYKDKQNLSTPLTDLMTLFKTKQSVKILINFNPLDI